MSSKKKKSDNPKGKKGGKYDITIAVDATFNDLLRAGVGVPPKEKQDDKDKKP